MNGTKAAAHEDTADADIWRNCTMATNREEDMKVFTVMVAIQVRYENGTNKQ